MTITDKLTSTKIVAALVAVAMIFGAVFAFSAHTASAQSISASQLIDLLIATCVIPADKADQARAVLSEQTSGGSDVCPYTWTRNLSSGSTGQDVRNLQMFLNDQGFQVASSGAGAPGNETDFFGSRTGQAVRAFQEAHASDVLAPVGLTSGTTFFGPSTRAKANALCTQAPAPTAPDEDEDMDEEEDETADEDFETSAEASLSDFSILGSPGNEDLSEGETKQVMGFEFDVNDGDVKVQRVDFLVTAENQSNGDKPWRYIDEVTLYHDDTELVTVDADSKGDWSDEGDEDGATGTGFGGGDGNNMYRLRLSGFSQILRANSNDNQFFVEVKTKGTLDTGDLNQDFAMMIAQDESDSDGVRAVDGTGLQHEIGSTNDTETMTFESSDTGQLTVTEHPDNPDERVVEVDDTTDTNDVTLAVFNIEADDQDIEIEDLVASTSVAGGESDINNVVKRMHLYQGSTKLKSKSIPSSAGNRATTTFDDIDFVINEDEKLEFSIKADIEDTNSQSRYSDGAKVKTNVRANSLSAEEITGNLDSLTAGNLNGTADGEYLHLYETAPQFTLLETTAERGDSDSNGDFHSGTFTIKLSVEADADDDVFVPFYSAVNANSIVASTTDGSGSTKTLSGKPTSTESYTISQVGSESDSGVSKETNTWKVPASQTGVFRVTGNINNDTGTTGFFAMKIQSLKWNTSDSTSGLTSFDFNLEDWETDPVNLDG
jgi:peptidoglycan hydrolase-like protein with peptidoglycan-binding domain